MRFIYVYYYYAIFKIYTNDLLLPVDKVLAYDVRTRESNGIGGGGSEWVYRFALIKFYVNNSKRETSRHELN